VAFNYPTGPNDNDYDDEESASVIPILPDENVVKEPGPEDLRDLTVQGMIARGTPLTRRNYLNRIYMLGDPPEWGAELEVDLPPMFRDPSFHKD
jgi:hypothetical protein